MRFIIPLFIISVAFWTTGCMMTKPNADYDRAFVATQTVLGNHGLMVKPSNHKEYTLIATSTVRGDFLQKTRVKIVAQIRENEDGHFEPSIQVLDQLDNSEPKVFGHSSYQPNHQWITVGKNAAMEAKLYNEVMELLYGQKNQYDGKAWRPIPENNKRHQPRRPYRPQYSKSQNSEDGTEQTQVEFTPQTW